MKLLVICILSPMALLEADNALPVIQNLAEAFGFTPKISFWDLVHLMVQADLRRVGASL